MVGCSAYGCSNRSEKGFSLKCFPTNPTRRAIWIAAVNRENWTPSQHSRLCEVCLKIIPILKYVYYCINFIFQNLGNTSNFNVQYKFVKKFNNK